MKFIQRVRLSAFRCYDDVDVELDHVNIFVGPNNSGKSAVLRAIRRLASVDLNRHPRVAERAGTFLFPPTTPFGLAPGDMRDGSDESRLTLDIGESLPLAREEDRVTSVHARFRPEGGTTLWVDGAAEPPEPDKVDDRAAATVSALDALPIVVIPDTRGLPRILSLLDQQDDTQFHEEIVDAERLLPTLIQWICEGDPRLNIFVVTASNLLGEALKIMPDPRSSAIRVQLGHGASRDVRNLGAGIVEILTLSAALTIHTRGLLLYEEPELHLHPRMQRRVVAKLVEQATKGAWQVLLTTHSNHVLDCGLDDGIAAFSVTQSSGVSRLTRLFQHDRARVHDLFDALGVRPSSGLQPQALIWVEGPSDATYLRFFLKLADESLSEYIDYSFAFFGGALLAHQAASSTRIEGLIDLVGIHRNSYVIFDSDRETESALLGKKYAQDFQERCTDKRRLWITWGREIENYLRDEILCWAAANRSPQDCEAQLETTDRRFAIFAEQVRALRTARALERAYKDTSEKNKSNFAREAVARMQKYSGIDWLEIGDLRDRVGALAEFVRSIRD